MKYGTDAIVTIATKHLIMTALSFQSAVLSFAALGFMGIGVPFLRETICFIYLTFIPGLLILPILKVKLDLTETLLLSAGLSASSIMLLVSAFNELTPAIGFGRPISEIPIMLLLASFVVLLCIACCLRNKDFSMTFHFNLPMFWLLSLWLLPLSLYGGYQLIAHDNNAFLLLLYAIISLFPLLVALNKMPEEIHPLVIWVISFSLLIPTFGSLTFVSETIMPNVLVRQGVWNPEIYYPHNALLHAVLDSVFFLVCGFENVLSELKIVVPFFYSLTPVALYQLFRKETDERTAFLSSFLFMSWFWFFGDVSPRQKYAELFISFLLLSAFNDRLQRIKKSFFSIIFAFSLILSHYGASYLFMFSLIIAFALMFLVEKINLSKIRQNLSSLNFVSLYSVMALSWYLWTAGSANFITFVNFYRFILEHLNELFSPEASYTLASITKQWNSVSIELLKYLLISICFLITIGILHSLYKSQEEKTIDEHLILSATFLVMLGSTFLPVGGGFDTSRIFHITLILLAPFSVIGLKIMFENLKIEDKHLMTFASLVLVFFLLNSGFTSEFIPNDYSPNALVNKKAIIEGNNLYGKYLLYRDDYRPPHDVQASEWMRKYSQTKAKVYCDRIGWGILATSKYGELPEEIRESLPKGIVLNRNTRIDNSSYIFLAYHNNIEKLVFVIEKSVNYYNLTELPLEKMGEIYSNGGSSVYITTGL